MALNAILLLLLSPTLVLTTPVKGRIVNGHDTDITEVPFQAIILRDLFPVCSGVILSERIVISAAYCFEAEDINEVGWNVRVGTSDRMDGGSVEVVQSIIYHPNAEEDPLSFNVALVKLAISLTFSEKVGAVMLPAPEFVVDPNAEATVSGFGIYDLEELVYPDRLQSGKVSIVPQSLCTEAYAQIFPVRSEHICSTGDVSPCTGDEGSPLVQNGTLIGIVSFGFDCENTKYPTVYSRISEFMNFINEHL